VGNIANDYNNPNRENNTKNKKITLYHMRKSIELDKLQNDSDYYCDELDIKCKACDLKLYRIFNEIPT
jgi:hypothetical protein